MSSVTNRITIGRPIEDVFAVLTDIEKTGVWFPVDVEERWTSPPPHGVGSTRHAVVRMLGRRIENDAVVTEYDPPHRARIAGTTPNAPFIGTLVFGRAGEGTSVEVTTEFLLRGASRVAGTVVAWWYGRAWSRGLRTLKGLLEAGEL
jgi:hypothetical protein